MTHIEWVTLYDLADIFSSDSQMLEMIFVLPPSVSTKIMTHNLWVIIYDDIQYWDLNESKSIRFYLLFCSICCCGRDCDLCCDWKIRPQSLRLKLFQIIYTWALPQMKIRSFDSFSLVSHDLILSHDRMISRDVLSVSYDVTSRVIMIVLPIVSW